MKEKGQIGVATENIFPIIKKFLYSDHEIFLRELVSNAVDATQKLKTLTSVAAFQGELGDLNINIRLGKNTITISDRGIGMTADEINQYINQIAFSSANDFLDKYKNDANAIIGHFGLGFYSSFMVSKKVEIITKSYQDTPAMKWSCDGSPEYTLTEAKKEDRGTDVILYIDDENKEFLEKSRIESLLKKYCKFLPIPIVFGKKQEWKDGKYVDTEEDNIINDTQPLWTRKPVDLKEEDYKKFYGDLYPFVEEPLFWIHLNVDYPFNLTGVLYFPKIKNNFEFQRNKIQLFCNQVYVTDSVEGIVPEFLTLLHGVIDSPDIPLNVSRSYLQSDQNVKKISNHVTKKVSDRLEEIFKNDRPQFEEKWDSLKIFIEYGMLSEDKFYERAEKFALVKNTNNQFFTLEEYKMLIQDNQTDKNKNLIYLYANNKEEQYAYINQAIDKGYDVLLMDGQLDVHWLGKLEQKMDKCRFVRVDGDVIEKLIAKTDNKEVSLSEEERNQLVDLFKSAIPPMEKTDFIVGFEHLGEYSNPVTITQNEFMRRMKEMSATQGGGFNMYGDMPDSYNMVVNLDHPTVKQIREDAEKNRTTATATEQTDSTDTDQPNTTDTDQPRNPDPKLNQIIDLALLSNGLLKGEALDKFIKRSMSLI